MPRSGVNGTYNLPGAQSTQVPGTPIPSAVNNQGWSDVEQTFNTPTPIAYGGTNAATPSAARTNLSAFGIVQIQDFTASGTYTPNANMICCMIELVGGGGGGGGCAAVAASQVSGAGGGGSGAFASGVFTKADIGASKAVTIGALGAGGAAGNNPGGGGGTTSVGSLLSAAGGNPGSGAVTGAGGTGGAGGSSGTGVLFIGENGSSGCVAAALNVNGNIYGGKGGGSPFGYGGRSVINANGIDASGYGSGGGGGSDFSSGGNRTGGSGRAGFVRIIEFCSE